MNFDGRRIGVARFAAVLPGVRGLRRLDKEPRRGDVATLFGYHRDTAPGTVVAQNMVVVVPKDVSWWLRAEVYGARQIYRASRANVQIWTSEYRRCRYCDKNNHFLSPFLPLPNVSTCAWKKVAGKFRSRPKKPLEKNERVLYRISRQLTSRNFSSSRAKAIE